MDEAALDERLRALAHPVRRRLVTACLGAPQPAGALVALCDLVAATAAAVGCLGRRAAI